MTSVYGPISDRLPGQIVYGLTTSGGMIGLIVALVGGVLASVVALLMGVAGGASIWIGVVGGVVIMAALMAYAMLSVDSVQSSVSARFPTPGTDASADAGE